MRNRKGFSVLAALMAVAMMFLLPMDVKADQGNDDFTVQGDIVSVSAEDDGISGEELYEGYVADAFGMNNGIALLSANMMGERLTGKEKIVYDALKPQIEKVANGELASAEFKIPVENLLGGKLSYTAADLGVSNLTAGGSITQEAHDAAYGLLSYDLSQVMDALLFDCPYELYWYKKTVGCSNISPGISYNSSIVMFQAGSFVTVCMTVDSAYSNGTAYGVDTAKTGAAATAAANAKAIVDSAAMMSDYDKIDFYRQKVCELTDYNHDAAAASNGVDVYGISPWQMIYVFDNDPSTKVVCEGYSKAFQYLMEMTTFDDPSIYSFLVSGYMGSDNMGPHMWNMVHMDDGKIYLADITNCDTGMAGEGRDLFLQGYTDELRDSSSNFVGYSILIPRKDLGGGYYRAPQTMYYQFDAHTLSMYSAEELTIPTTDYVNPTENAVNFKSVSLVLSGEIGVNFFVELPDAAKVDGAYMEFTVNGKSTRVDYSGAGHPKNSSGYYQFTCSVNSIQMADTITAVYHYGSNASAPVEYSVETYLNVLKNGAYSTQLKNLAAKLQDYGYYAQQMFAEKNGWTIGVEHQGVSSEGVTVLSPGAMQDFSANALSLNASLPAGVTFAGYSLNLDSYTSINMYFDITGAVPSFTLDGAPVTAALVSGNRYRVAIPNITAGNLDHSYKLRVNNTCEFTVSAFSYAHTASQIAGTTKDALKKTLMALKNYSDAVKLCASL